MAALAIFGSILCAALPASAQDASQQAERPLSRAQTELFRTPHLANVKQPETLEYDFSRYGPVPFKDSIDVNIRKINPDGSKDVTFRFLSGKNSEIHPEVDDFHGNPLLMVFLEHDVRTLQQSIGISTTYWRNRIRDALLESAKVEDITASVGGKDVPARRITVRPFANQDRLVRVPPVHDKLYTFILADAVPGGIVEMRTDMAADKDLGVPAAGESVVFNRVQAPMAPGAAKP